MRSLVIVVMLCLLSGCITAYRSPHPKIVSCAAFESDPENAKTIAEDFDSAASLVELNKSASKYAKPASHNDEYIEPIVLRYSEAGNIVNPCDYSRALAAAQDVPGEKKIILVFAHGWRNDSGRRSNITYNFDNELKPMGVMGSDYIMFAKFAARVSEDAGVPVLPIFVSWKGGTGLGPVDYLSFWDRRAAADRISRSAEINRLAGALENIKAAHEDNGGKFHIVYLGHSFGARILLQTMSADLVTRTQQAASNDHSGCDTGSSSGDSGRTAYKVIDSPADLVVLINPAVEAAAYRAIDEFRHSSPCFSSEQRQLMLILQSESDKAVGVAFPLGQFWGSWLNTSRITAVGFYEHFRTHRLKMIDKEVTLVEEMRSGAVETPTYVTPFQVVFIEEEVLDGHVWFNRTDSWSRLYNNDEPLVFDTWLINQIIGDFKLKTS